MVRDGGVAPWGRHQRRELAHEVQRIERHVRRPVAPRMTQAVDQKRGPRARCRTSCSTGWRIWGAGEARAIRGEQASNSTRFLRMDGATSCFVEPFGSSTLMIGFLDDLFCHVGSQDSCALLVVVDAVDVGLLQSVKDPV